MQRLLKTAVREAAAGAPGTALIVAITLAGSLLAFVLHSVMLRLGGVETYASFAFLLSAVGTASMAATLGYDALLQQALPALIKSRKGAAARAYLAMALRDGLAASAVIGALGFLILWRLDLPAQGELTAALLAAFLLPLAVAVRLGAATVVAFGRVPASVLPERIVRDGVAILLVVAAASMDWVLTPALAMFALVMGLGVAAALLVRGWRRDLAPVLAGSLSPGASAPAALLRLHAGTLAVIGALSYGLQRAPLIVGFIVLQKAEAAAMAIAVALAELVGFTLTAVMLRLVPRIGVAAAAPRGALSSLLVQSMALGTAGGLVACLCLWLALPIFSRIFGPAMDQAVFLLAWLAAAQLLRCFAGASVQVLCALGRHGVVLAAFLAANTAFAIAAWAGYLQTAADFARFSLAASACAYAALLLAAIAATRRAES
jgi:O-antigen/teichoic acid export membrane protein